MTVLLMKLNVQWSFIAVHVVEKITLLGTAGKTVVIEMKRNKRHKRSECVETTKEPAKALQRKRKAEAEEDKLVKTKIRKAEVPQKMCLRCTIADWLRKKHQWARGHSSQQDHEIL